MEAGDYYQRQDRIRHLEKMLRTGSGPLSYQALYYGEYPARNTDNDFPDFG
jgi:hypothetical protein